MWLGGFSGVGFDRAEFAKWLSTQDKPTWAKFIAIHATGAPYTLASVGGAARMKNLGHYYQNQQKWKGGPHLFVMGTKVYPGTPIKYPSVHSPSWNNIALAIECEGDYRKTGKHSHLSGPGAINWDAMAWAVAEIMTWLKWQPDTNLAFHREDPRTSHRECPGNIDKGWFIEKVKAAMGTVPVSGTIVPNSEPTKPHPNRSTIKKGSTGGDVPVLQKALNENGANPPLVVDGDFGPKTDAAVRAYQARTGLVVDGVVGPMTWGKLASAANSEAPPEPKPAPEPDVPVLPPLEAMHISAKGRELIEHFEGCPTDKATGLAVPYDDVGSLAICFGHSNRSKKPPTVTWNTRLTLAECDKILAQDLIDYENRVKQSIKVPLKQHQFDALTSIAYNWGPGNLDRSKLKELVNAGKHTEAEAEIRRILPSTDKPYYKGILRRRNAEADLYGGK